ncbi:MAG: hypothetical protein K6F26_00635 [Lachnospiraceae bacterium]|nr:hypothetical protein [Lachnospiraceae bacterium]
MHIFLLILKIIGIVLLCVIGLVLLILAALLFAPFRYEVSAEGDKNGPTAHADVKVRWLLRIVSFRLLYDLPGTSKYVVRVFGIPVKKSDGKKEEEEKKDEEGESKPEESAEDKKEEAKPESESTEASESAKPEAVSADPSVTVEAEKPETETAEADTSETAEESKEDSKEESKEDSDSGHTEETVDGEHSEELPQELAEALEGKKKSKIREKIDKLKEKTESLLDSLEAMFALFMKKKGLLEKYVNKKSTKKAIKMVFVNGLWVLKHICPKKYHGNVEFGMDDPAMTGDICAAISPWYPIIADYLKITPNFEPGLGVSGDIFLKGRIRLWGILIRALKVYRNKNVRKVLRDAEKVKETITKTPDEVKEIFEKAA